MSLEAFVKWCRDSGIVFDGIELCEAGEDSGNGLFAQKSFRIGENVISLPAKAMLTGGRVANMDKFKPFIAKAYSEGSPLTPYECLTLFFYLETGADSKWAPYLNMLPKTFDTPTFQKLEIDPAHLPSTIRDLWIKQQNEIASIWTKLSSILESDEQCYDRFLWAWHVVNTRCIYVENELHPKLDNSDGDTIAVIPFVDMFNHSASAQGHAGYHKITDSYTVTAQAFIGEGNEVYVCYGPHDNSRLWMEYGFRIPNNINTKVAISHDLFLALAKKVRPSITADHEAAVREAGLPCSLYASDEGPSWPLQTSTRLLLLNKSETKKWKDIIYSEKEKRFRKLQRDSDESDEEYEKKVVLDTRELLVSILTALRTNFEAKIEKTPDIVSWMWNEQLQLIETVLDRLAEPLPSDSDDSS